MFTRNFCVHLKRLRSVVSRNLYHQGSLIRPALEGNEGGIAEKYSPGGHLQHKVARDVLRLLEVLSVLNGRQFHSGRAVSKIAEHDPVVIPPSNVPETHAFGDQGADIREQLRPGRPRRQISDVTDHAGSQQREREALLNRDRPFPHDAIFPLVLEPGLGHPGVARDVQRHSRIQLQPGEVLPPRPADNFARITVAAEDHNRFPLQLGKKHLDELRVSLPILRLLGTGEAAFQVSDGHVARRECAQNFR